MKYFMQRLQIDIYSKGEPIGETYDLTDLDIIRYACTEGDSTGIMKWTTPIEVSETRVVEAMRDAGEDPEDFGIGL